MKGKQDPIIYQEKLKQLKELYLLEEKGELDVCYVDESGFSLEPCIPYGWQAKGEYTKLLPQKSKRLNVFGIINKQNNLTSFISTHNFDSKLVVACIDDFSKTITNKTFLIIDNASIHTSNIFKNKIEEWKKKGLYIFYLPTYLNIAQITCLQHSI